MFVRSFSFLMLTSAIASSAPHAPIEIDANVLTYYKNTDLFTAEGRVKIQERQYADTSKNKTVWADKVIYHKLEDKIVATGNVIVRDEQGNLTYSDQVELKDQFKDGFADHIRMITTENERILANKGTRTKGKLSTFQDSSYTPCKICEGSDPTWELKAEEVVHDKEAQEVRYKNARLEFKGVPVFYTPYFSHPDPTVKRRSGLLRPTFGSSTQLGAFYGQPVYYVIDEFSDATFSPTVMSNDNPLLAAEYRRKIMDGELETSGSYIRSKYIPKPTTVVQPHNGPRAPAPDRWHLFSKLEKDLNSESRLRIRFNRASDTTYLRRYPMIMRQAPTLYQNPNLTSLVNYEYFGVDTYATARSYYYQTDQPKTTPIVLPTMTFAHQVADNHLGGTWFIDGNIMSLYRDEGVVGQYGTRTHRLSSKHGWDKHHITDGGHVFHVGITNQVDGYHTKSYIPERQIGIANPPRREKMATRFYPQTFVQYDYPLLSRLEGMTSITKPMLMVVAGGKRGNGAFIPNEDARSFALDDTNIFQPNRFNGRDRVDTGMRVVYGLDQTYYLQGLKQINVFLGQTRRFDRHQALNPLDGENKRQSDVVARLLVQPTTNVNTRFRTAVDPYTKRMRFYEVGADFGQPIFKMDMGYVNLPQRTNLHKNQMSQLHWQLSSQVHENWQLSIAEIRNLNKTAKGSLDSFAAVKYNDDCFQALFSLYKSRFTDRDIKPNTGFMFQISFKNLATFTPIAAPVYSGTVLSQFAK